MVNGGCITTAYRPGVLYAWQISQGLLIDEATEERCQELYDRGMALMKVGRRSSAHAPARPALPTEGVAS